MATIHEAYALAQQEKRLGSILDFGHYQTSDGRPAIWFSSIDGGVDFWWHPDVDGDASPLI